MRPTGLHHVSINVDDVAAARHFYVDLLGFAERTDRPDFPFDGAWLDIGGQQIHLIEGEVPPGKGQHFAVAVADLAATVTELRAHGLEVSEPKPVATALQCFTHDPAGNLVELHEPGGAAADGGGRHDAPDPVN
ncbi:MAG: VOC family protein [Ilumatobacteraceae bacterium]